MSSRSASVCAFCDEQGSSAEHVFAKWITEALGGPGPFGFNLNRQRGRSKTSMGYLGLISRAARVRCNNEWMSGFEQTARPLLAPVLRGVPTSWETPADQMTIARWAFKTALVANRSGRPETWTAPDAEFRYLFKNREPPPTVTMHVGFYAPLEGEEPFAVWVGSSWASARSASGVEVKGYRITFSVGHVIFQTNGHVSPADTPTVYEPRILREENVVADAMRRLWPLTGTTHEWPPRGANFSTSGLYLLEPRVT